MDVTLLGQRRPEQRTPRLPEEDVTARARGTKAGGAHHVDAQATFLPDGRLARVQTHAHADSLATRPLVLRMGSLCLHRAGHCVARPRERAKSNESPCMSISTPPCSPNESRTIRRCSATSSPQRLPPKPLQERRRALDVRKDEGDGAGLQKLPCDHSDIAAEQTALDVAVVSLSEAQRMAHPEHR